MLVPKKQYLTPQEYLYLERKNEWRSEYCNGEMYAMSGASWTHNIIVNNIAFELTNQLKGRPCYVLVSDMRVKVTKTGLYAYPDVIAICGEAILEDEYVDTLLNPVVIVEVLSKSTEAYDRGAKFDHYRAIESLQEYVLVSQDKFLIECYSRQSDNQWLLSIANKSADSITLPSIQCSLTLTKVYDRVDAINPTST